MFISANTTPFLAETFPYQDKHAEKWCVAVVRATFDVDLQGNCEPSREQTPFVYADTHYGDPDTTSVRAETDFAPIKQYCELLLDAVAIAPGGTACETLEVGVLGPNFKKRAVVVGPRRWRRGAFGLQASQPTPFITMPLAWHLTFGGWDRSDTDPSAHRSDAVNPIGKGFIVREENGDAAELPCIEDPRSPMRAWNDRPVPIGFGPLPRFAAARARYSGTYDKNWMDNVLPFLPQDFDDRYFQSAPEDQQGVSLVEGTTFACLNMSKTGIFKVCLPRFSLPLRFIYDDRVEHAILAPDTLTILPHESKIVLVGRTRTKLPRKFVRLQHVQVGHVKNPRISSKPRYPNLGDAVAAMLRLRKDQR